MNVYADFFYLLLGMIAFLVAATLLGEGLRKVFSGEGAKSFVEAYAARVTSWWGMVVLLAIAFAFGQGGVIVLFAFISFAALREFLTLTAKTRADHWSLLISFFVILPLQYFLIYIDWYGLYSILIPVYAYLLLPIASAVRGEPERFLRRVAETQWALMITVFAASHIPALLSLDIEGFEGRQILLIAWLVIVIQGADVLQYVWSRMFGRHPVAANLSRSKTWEGYAAGTASGMVIGVLLGWLTPFSIWQTALMAGMITLIGFFGSLVMAAIKRDKGVRDWGHLIAGHGGFTDRLDAVVFAAPLFFHVVRFFWTAS
ncbi:phosphatidate cytidylyltransferase [Maritimibacter dapengensis]|uniref:Phosphatidate cytidylyltransferase n=1 Tax=Maritimibacter dapengensis TaxID=2836868 RepID=A0ABS6SWQ1_9RHOB|nr:phosphatidate cytidylyltransferase [Maritimibacter dapengensis]MBV7377391.1 phosphatidate cytidylyltransferase [Maritimibacter dapengensis]